MCETIVTAQAAVSTGQPAKPQLMQTIKVKRNKEKGDYPDCSGTWSFLTT